MTAQGEDLLAWLETAISEREEAAQRATQTPWRTHDTHLDLGGHTATILTGERNDTELLAWVPTMSHESWDETRNAWNNAEHIALNDPASVLRRCAADRKLLDLHRPVVLRGGGGARYFKTTTVCKSCEPPRQFPETAYPCPTIVSLAEGYGWVAPQTPPTEGDQVT